MSQALADYLINLGRNPQAHASFKNDPHGSMTVAGLPAEDIAAVLSGNPALIHNAVVSGMDPAVVRASTDIVIVVVLRA